jgi:16S rRNA (guanine527-N7)-methyltransferase
VTSQEFADRLRQRADRVALILPDDVIGRLEAYVRLLAAWNQKINLTALPLNPPSDETFDRLLIEPLIAARHVPPAGGLAIDVGSGGGSPAIPLAIASPQIELTMVESRSRKAVFLAEAARATGLSRARVISKRLEELANGSTHRGVYALATMRAVRLDREMELSLLSLLGPGGALMVFGGPSPEAAGFAKAQHHPLLDSELIITSKI